MNLTAAPVLVFGSAGQVGRELMKAAPPTYRFIGLPRAEVDISDRQAVEDVVSCHRPQVIINAAAYTAVDRAESEAEQAFAVNETGAANLAAAAHANNAAIIHISTDYVFDGTKPEAYVETDPISPINVYGRSKEAGERAVRNGAPRHIILRTAWVYAAHGRNFMQTMLRLAREGKPVRVVADQYGSPTAASDIARAIVSLLPQVGADSAYGTYHLTNSGRTSWHGFAAAIFDELAASGLPRPQLEAITIAEFPTPAKRPAQSVLDCSKIERAFGIVMRPWREALRETMSVVLAEQTQRSSA